MPNVSVGGVSGIWLNATYAASVPEMTIHQALDQQPAKVSQRLQVQQWVQDLPNYSLSAQLLAVFWHFLHSLHLRIRIRTARRWR
jgi:hypothetical protein